MKPEWFQRWQQTNPLAVLALAATAGLLVADRWSITPSIWLGGAAMGALSIACWRPKLWKFVPAAMIGFAYVHAVRLGETYAHPLRERLLMTADKSQRATVQGRLFPWQDGVELDAARAGAEISAVRWEGSDAFERMPARVKVVLPPGTPLKEPGVYEMTGTFWLPRPPMSPGQFDGAAYSLRMGWVAVLKADSLQVIKPEPMSPKFHLLRWAEASRQWITRALSLGIEDKTRDNAVVLAMALGASSAAGDDVEEAFRNSGTLHVFAVSGLHVVMVATVMGFLLRLLGLGRARAAALLIVMVFVYAYVTGWRPSAARAAFMIAIVLTAPLLNRQAALQNSLGAAALMLFLMDTHQLFLAGFQLSFGVLWAIAIAATWLMDQARWWSDLDPFLPAVLAGRRQRGEAWARGWGASMLCVSLAAWTGSLPLILGHFQTVTPVALIANCVLVPLSSFCITFACLSLCCAAVGFTFGQLALNHLNAVLAQWMVASAAWFAALPMANFHVDLRHEKPAAPVEMRVFQLPGGGAANHLRNGGSNWMLDCGNADAWRRVVFPYLREQGINKLDGLILSHGDASHVGAAPLALKAMEVTQLHTSRHEPWRYDPPFSSLRQLSLLAPPGGAVWRRHGIDEEIYMGDPAPLLVTATVLHPQAADVHEKADDRGLVLMIRVGQMRVLWLGDAGFMTEKRLLERQVPLRCELVIRNQHSADTSGLPELLLAARPQAVISSNDAWLVEEHLPERLRAFCAKQGIPLFDLGACGSVSIRVEAEQARLEAFSNGQTATIRPPDPGELSAGK
ncbi:MAG: ComEC/Rec2 family competence protein [Prosthecobacter sp.]|nr:ComEC/Rec2 family competence protein [Prosthecobacter sp.]